MFVAFLPLDNWNNLAGSYNFMWVSMAEVCHEYALVFTSSNKQVQVLKDSKPEILEKKQNKTKP